MKISKTSGVMNLGIRVGGKISQPPFEKIRVNIYSPVVRMVGNEVSIKVEQIDVNPHVADQMLNAGAGTVFICADTSVVEETRQIKSYLNQFGIKLRKQTTNPTLLRQYIEKVKPASIIKEMYKKMGEDTSNLAMFKEKMRALGQEEFYFQATQFIYKQLLDVLGKEVPLSVEVDYTHGKTTCENIVEQARRIVAKEPFNSRVVIKVPVTRVGLEAIEKLTRMGIRTNATLVFTLRQAVEAAMAGATFVSPFAGRFTAYISKLAKRAGLPEHKGDLNYDPRFGRVGMDFVEQVTFAFEKLGFRTMIIPASIRSDSADFKLEHLKRVWEISRHASVPLVPTIPTKVLMAPESLPWLLLFHETTREKKFDTDYEFGHPLLVGDEKIGEKGGLNNFDADSALWKKMLWEELKK